MKKLILLAILIALKTTAFAQTSNLPTDSKGMIAFHGVIETPGLRNETLYQNAQDFLSSIKVVNQKKKENYLIEEEGKVTTLGGFLVYNYKSPDGEIRYNILMEVKDNKYRYTITEFVFYPYTRNRYGRFEREKWKPKSLDELVSKGEEKSRNNHKAKTAEKMERLISKMTLAMERLPVLAEESRPSMEVNW